VCSLSQRTCTYCGLDFDSHLGRRSNYLLLKLSVIIPSHNEAGSLPETVEKVCQVLTREGVEYEILVINDHSTDETSEVSISLQSTHEQVQGLNNPTTRGYGMAVRHGLSKYTGDCVAIMMADGSDAPDDLIAFYQTMLSQNVDCVFGSRFEKGGSVVDYPRIKYVLNRFANHLVRLVFGLTYSDCTNAFKLYSRNAIDGIQPLLSPHFNLTLEMPLKAIVRGYTFTVLPNSWTNRKHGQSKLKIKEMGSRYFFIFLYCLIEKYFSKGDYKKSTIRSR